MHGVAVAGWVAATGIANSLGWRGFSRGYDTSAGVRMRVFAARLYAVTAGEVDGVEYSKGVSVVSMGEPLREGGGVGSGSSGGQ